MSDWPEGAFVDAYAVLGVRPDASAEELKAAHRALVRRHHPDLVPASERAAATRRVQELNVAYGLVRDPERRAEYDRLRRWWLASRRERRVEALDGLLATQWDEAARAAGRWAATWWARNREPLRRGAIRAVLRVRRAARELLARLPR